MSEHDLNLIADVISGDLSPRELDAALAHIASDPALQAEYETQLATASLLHDLPSPSMTAEERSTLHASLRQQLHLDDAPTPVVAPAPSRWQRWWAPVTGLAAAAAVVVGAIVILPGGGSDDSFDVASASLAATTVAARDADPSVGGGADSDGSVNEEAAPTEAASEAETTTTTAAAETTTTAAATAEDMMGDEPPAGLPHLPEGDLEEIALAYTADPQAFGLGLASLMKDSSSAVAPGADACVAEASATAGAAAVVVAVATTTVDGVEAAVVSVTPPDTEPYFVALDLATCEELDSTRP